MMALRTSRATTPNLLLEQVSIVFDSFCRTTGFNAMTTGADKHGSLVWEAGSIDGLNRYVTFALTERGRRSSPYYDAELSIGADDNRRYTHQVSKSWRFQESSLHGEPGRQSLYDDLLDASNASRAILEEELTSEYVVPRPPAADLGPGSLHTRTMSG